MMVVNGVRVSIPSTTRKMIMNIKEITAGNYSEDEILAMLHECNMDPNEATQRILLQDPFHEVKNKRDKRKENIRNKNSVESPWRSGGQSRGSRGGRINFSSYHTSHDVAGAKNSFRKGNGPKQVTDPSSSTTQGIKTEDVSLVSSPSAVIDKRSVGLTSGSSDVHHPSNLPASSGQLKATRSSIPSNNLHGAPYSVQLSKNRVAFSTEARSRSSNPKPVSEQTAHEQHIEKSKFHARSRGVGKTAMNDSYVPRPASSHSNSSGVRPSSNYNYRSHQTVGPQRGTGSVKEWKPKPVDRNTTQRSGASSTTEALAVPTEALAVPTEALAVPTEALAVPTEASDKSVEDVIPSAEATSKLQRQIEDLQIQRQHIIIPNNILVPEARRTKFCFGSFDADFSITSSSVASRETEKRSAPLFQNSQVVEESFEEEEEFSHQTAHSTEKEEDNNVYTGSSSQVPNNMTSEGITATDAAPEYHVSENMLESESNQNPFDYAPQFENPDPQACDALSIPNFMVQQHIDPASYYAQFYRSAPDNNGHASPFISQEFASRFHGNVTVLPPHSSQSMQEDGNNLVLTTASPTPLVTGIMQSSIPVTQQPVSVFRPPGLHMSHYPPNYMPYGNYFSPYYLPPPPMHQYLNNGAFTQQPLAPPHPGAATGSRYTHPHYRPGTNTGNLTHLDIPSGYGPTYGSFPAGYNPTSSESTGNSTSNEDHHYNSMEENNGYNTTGQQSEALPVWISGGGRDGSSSFYGLQQHGQHMSYGQGQGSQVMYNPGQEVTRAGGVHHQSMVGAEMVQPAANVFQQQTPMNWPSNY